MSGIWNISGSTNVEPKKITSKLSFDIGDVFLAKITGKDDSTQMVEIKTVDGWKFQAKLDKPLDQIFDGLVRFQVEGMENGVLTLKVFDKPDGTFRKIEQDIQNILKELNIDFTEEDLGLFLKMIKFNMPLTKENIAQIKSLIDFQRKIKENEEEEQSFILKYLSKNNIDPNSEEGKQIESYLKGFFTSLKSLSHEDILALKENGIELTKDNIDSFKRIIDNDNVIYDDIKELGLTLEEKAEDHTDKVPDTVNNISNTAVKNLINLMENRPEKLIKEISAGIKDIVRSLVENEVNQDHKSVSSSELKENYPDADFINNVSEKIDNVVSDIIDNEIAKFKLSFADTKSEKTSEPAATEVIEYSELKGNSAASEISASTDTHKSTEAKKSINTFTENFKADMVKTLGSKSGSIAQEILTKTDTLMPGTEKIIKLSNTLTEKITESVYRSFDNYLIGLTDTPKDAEIKSYLEDLLNKEFDNIKEFDKNNTQIVNKFFRLKEEIIDKVRDFLQFSYLIKDEEGASEGIAAAGEELKNNIGEAAEKEMGSGQLKNDIEKIIDDLVEVITDTVDNARKENQDSVKNTKETIENVKKEFMEKNRELIADIKDFLQQKSQLKPEQYNKIVNELKNNINDFKVYNSLSNNYYLLDLPINLSDRKYNCKLMIKDDRKNGKKIDSRDVKFVVSVGTLNMGTIDAFINVKNNNLKIDVKSESKWVRLLNSGRNILADSLKSMGYNVYLTFSESKAPADLPGCREFFNDFSLNILDTKV